MIKILFQVQGISAGSKPVQYTSVTESLRSLVQRDGVRGLCNCATPRTVKSKSGQSGARQNPDLSYEKQNDSEDRRVLGPRIVYVYRVPYALAR